MSIRKVSRQGAAGLAAVIAIAALLAAYAINEIRFGGEMHRTNQQLHEFNADILPPPGYLIESYLEATLIARDPASVGARAKRLAALEKDFNARFDHWSASDLEPALRDGFATTVREDGKAFWSLVDNQLIPAARAGDRAAIDRAADEIGAVYTAHRKRIDRLVADAAAHQMTLAEAASATLTFTTVILLLAALMVGGGVGAGLILLRNRVIWPLHDTADVMERMAGGDLAAGERDAHGNDEIGTMTRAIEVFRTSARSERENALAQQQVVEALQTALARLAEGDFTHRITAPLAPEYEPLRQGYNASVERLAAMMASLRQTAGGVGTGAREIHMASSDLATRNERQAANLEETAATLNQITALVQDTAANAARVQAAMSETHVQASRGGEVVRRAVDAMSAIAASSQQIRQVVDVIDGIAFQTNLLALNAGVEAARAGAAGSGFAVVANEVRALAQRSAEAAQGIKQMVANSNAQVSEGVALVDETGTLLSGIVARVGEVNGEVAHIAEGAGTQAASLSQINTAIGDMDRMTQQNAAMVEQATAAAQSLADEAGELAALVAQFRIEDVRAPAARAPAHGWQGGLRAIG
ncbi:methyl-accepting chemotaxis protein [Erythrobacter colymbi]|uniref:methyl-accepting chemotaxis protein n=1 Tax=Erythrobacter colymbi TaxID=1161202 RepID=UPI000A39DC3A|nr:methyl-accepting chemotaxis protein [Erythrobacter colymbi]